MKTSLALERGVKNARSDLEKSKLAQSTKLTNAHDYVIEDLDPERLTRPDQVPSHLDVTCVKLFLP